MDSLIAAAARALALGDPLGALNRVALRHDAPALALRGIAMAQLGDLNRAKALVRPAGAAARRRREPRRGRRAPSGRERRWRARDALSPKPRSRSLRATSPGLPRRLPWHRRPSKRMATAPTPPMRATSRPGASF